MRSKLCRISSAAILLTTTTVLSPVGAQVVSYEAASFFPDEVGWERDFTLFPADRWLENGWLVQFAEIVDPGPPEEVERDSYRRSIAEFSGSPTLFVEWTMFTDGPREGIESVAPAALVAGGQMGIIYHFTIAEDQIRFIRGSQFPVLWIDIEPEIFHTYRIELYADELYVWYIDGEMIDSGVPEGAYPTPDSKITFRGKAAGEDVFVWWEYIRYGVIPEDGGDFNSNGEIDSYDLYFFQECLQGPGGSWPGCAWADMDFDGDTDCDDWALFLAGWTDPADPPGMAECAIPPDFDGDGQVGAFDLAILLGSWGPCPDPPANCPADLDASGFVNAFDLAMLLGSWG
ncbi:MAG: hypothetical protein IID34_05605 [Planctomycetes bacterium]|nr:hypothetical protein [Planctomycetota bacterium]